MTIRKWALPYVENRPAALALIGLIWVMTGVGRIIEPLRGLPDEVFPEWLRAAAWLGPGMVAVVASMWRALDRQAWGLLAVPAGAQFVNYMVGWLWLQTLPTGWRGATIHLAAFTLVFFCARGLDRVRPWNGEERRWTTP